MMTHVYLPLLPKCGGNVTRASISCCHSFLTKNCMYAFLSQKPKQNFIFLICFCWYFVTIRKIVIITLSSTKTTLMETAWKRIPDYLFMCYQCLEWFPLETNILPMQHFYHNTLSCFFLPRFRRFKLECRKDYSEMPSSGHDIINTPRN